MRLPFRGNSHQFTRFSRFSRLVRFLRRGKPVDQSPKPRYWLLFFSVLLIMLLPAAIYIAQNAGEARADWYSSGGTWAQRKEITIDNTQVSGSSNHTDFPVLISLTSDSDLSTYAQADGDDILFTSSDGTTKLDHEIESYSSGTLVAWVEIPTLSYNSDTIIYMYYGNDAAANQENVNGTWNSGYLSVWHLEEQVTDESTAATHYNSTSTSANGTQNNNDDATGQISRGQDFDDSDYINMGDNNSLDLGDGTDLTISAWINADNLGDPADIVSKKTNNTAGSVGYKLYYGTNNLISFLVSDGTDAYEVQNTTAINSTSNWYYITAVFDENNSTNSKIFINGVDNSGTRTGTIGNVNSAANSSDFRIGSEADGTIMFDGIIDEVRMSTTVRSDDWIATEYANQSSPGSFYSVGSVENNNAINLSPKLAINFDEGLDNTCASGADACDNSGNGNDATMTGGSWQKSEHCTSGSCMFFDGSDDVATITNASAIDFDDDLNAEFTISTWVKVNSDGENNVGQIFSKGSTTYCRTDSESGGLVDLECSLDLATTDATLNISSALTLNRWHHVLLAYTDDADDEITIYIDGTNRGSSTNGVGSLATDANNLLIGGASAANFHGIIDEFRVYNYQATNAQAKGLAIKGAGLSPTSAVLGATNYDAFSDGMVGYYTMEGGGTAEGNTTADESGLGNTATLMGDNGVGDNGSGMTCGVGGKYGFGCDFDGVDDYLSVTDQDVFSFGDGTTDKPFSVAAWIYSDTDSGNRTIISKLSPGGSPTEWHFYVGAGDALGLQLHDDSSGGYLFASTAAAVPENTWVYVAATYSGIGHQSGIKLYIDGVAQNLSTASTSYTAMESTAANVNIGGASTTNNFSGVIDDVRVYNREISPSEINAIRNWSAPPIAHYKFDNPSGITFDNAAIYADNANGTGVSFDFEISDNPNGLLVVSITAEDATAADTAISGVTYAGQAMTQAVVALADSGSRNNRATIFYLLDPPAGNATVSVTFGGTVEGTTAAAYSFYNVDQAAPDSTGTYTNNSSSSSSISVTPIVNNSLIIDTHSHHDGGGTNNYTAGSGQIEIYEHDDAAGIHHAGASYKIVDSSGATTMTQSSSSSAGRFAGAAAVFAPAPITASVIDSSGNGYHGNPEGGLSGADQQPGIHGSSLQFDGSNDLVDVGTSINLQNFGGLSASAWVYYDSSGTDEHQIISNWEDTPNQASVNFRLEPSNDTVEVFVVTQSDTTTGGSFLDLVLTPNKWHHVAFSYDEADGLKAYLDGKESATTYAGAGALDADASPTMWLGHSPHGTPTDMLTGRLDDLRIYNYARTQAEIIEDLNGGNPLGSQSSSPYAYWSFDEMAGQTAYDRVNSSPNGTLGDTSSSESTDPTWLPASSCKVNGCLDFEADNSQRITLGDVLDLAEGQDLTVSGWFSREDTATDRTIISSKPSDTASDSGWTVMLDKEGGDKLWFLIGDGTDGYTLESTSTFSDSNWYHFVIVWDDDNEDNIKMYINGVDDNATKTGTLANIGSTNSSASKIGSENDNGRFFDGKIDELKVYFAALSYQEVLLDYNTNAGINFGTGTNEASTLEDGAGAGPVLYYDFNENTGTSTTADKSGNNLTGTLAGTFDQSKWVPGKYGSAVNLDGTDDSITRSAESALTITGDITISGWVYRDFAGAGDVIVGYQGSGETEAMNNLYSFILNSSNQLALEWEYGAGNNESITSSTTVTTTSGSWVHYAVIRDVAANTVTFFENGKQLGTVQSYTNDPTGGSTSTLAIGRDPASGNDPLDGKLDEIKIWNRALTRSQIAYEYNRGKPLAHWKLDACTGTTIYDATGNGYNGTLVNGGSGTNTSSGSCSSGNGNENWDNGTNGKYGASIDLDGTDDLINLYSANFASHFNGNEGSAVIWIKTQPASSEGYVMRLYADGTASMRFQAQPSQVTFYYEADNNIESAVSVIDTTEWTHLAMTWSDSNDRVSYFVNGNLVHRNSSFTQTWGTTALSSTRTLLGSDDSGSPFSYYNGQIDDARIYNYELSETQVRKIMNEGSGVRFGD